MKLSGLHATAKISKNLLNQINKKAQLSLTIHANAMLAQVSRGFRRNSAI